MAKYFCISTGLRGCYMPDNTWVIKVGSRRDLKSAVSYDAGNMREAYGFGGSKKEVASFVAACWREAQKERPAYLPMCLPFGRDREDRPFGIFVGVATRDEYLQYEKEEEMG